MNKKTYRINILHKPTGYYLCEDGKLRPGKCSGFGGEDTVVYRRIGNALKRVNTRRPGKKLREDFVNDIVLEVTEWNGVLPCVYRLDRNGVMLNDGHG